MTFPTATETLTAVPTLLRVVAWLRQPPIGMTKLSNIGAQLSGFSPRGARFRAPKSVPNYVTRSNISAARPRT